MKRVSLLIFYLMANFLDVRALMVMMKGNSVYYFTFHIPIWESQHALVVTIIVIIIPFVFFFLFYLIADTLAVFWNIIPFQFHSPFERVMQGEKGDSPTNIASMKRTLVFLLAFVMFWTTLEIMYYSEAILTVIHQSWVWGWR